MPVTTSWRWILVALLAGALAALAVSCVDFYDRIPCDNEDHCPYGYRCNGICEGPGRRCETDADCDAYEAIQNRRELLCVRMPWESEHRCRLICEPGSTSIEWTCAPGQDCRSLSDGTNQGACFCALQPRPTG